MNPYPEQRPGWRDDEERREFLVHKAVHLFYMPRLVPDIGVVPEGSTGWHIYIYGSPMACVWVWQSNMCIMCRTFGRVGSSLRSLVVQ